MIKHHPIFVLLIMLTACIEPKVANGQDESYAHVNFDVDGSIIIKTPSPFRYQDKQAYKGLIKVKEHAQGKKDQVIAEYNSRPDDLHSIAFSYQRSYPLSQLFPPEPSHHQESEEWLQDAAKGSRLVHRTSYFFSGYVCSNGGYYETRDYQDYVYTKDTQLIEVRCGTYTEDAEPVYSLHSRYVYKRNKRAERVRCYKYDSYEKEEKLMYQQLRTYRHDGRISGDLVYGADKKIGMKEDIAPIEAGIASRQTDGNAIMKFLEEHGIVEAVFYNYQDGRLQKIARHSQTYYEEYDYQELRLGYNAQGLLEYFDSPYYFGALLRIWYIYDAKGRLIKKHEDNAYGCSERCNGDTVTEQYTYNEDGKIKTISYDYSDDKLDEYIRYSLHY